MDANNLILRYSAHAERIVISQIVFVGERKLREIVQPFQIIRVHARLVEALLVHCDVVVGMGERPFHSLKLKRHDLVTAGRFDSLQFAGFWAEILHVALPSSSKSVPPMARENPRNSAINFES